MKEEFNEKEYDNKKKKMEKMDKEKRDVCSFCKQ